MFSLYFAGGEHPGWRKPLRAAGVENLAVNFTHLVPRMPKHRAFNFKVFDAQEADEETAAHGGFKVLLYTTPVVTDTPEVYQARYEEFVEANAGRIEVLVEPDLEGLTGRREEWADLSPDGFVPLWDGQEDLGELAGRYGAVAVTQDVLEQDKVTRALLSTAHQRWGARTLALGISSPSILEQSKFAMAVSSAWTSVARRGETMVWDGSRLHRYPAKQKDEVRMRHRATIQRSGVDVEAVLAGEKSALVSLAIWSWQEWADSVNQRRGGRLPLEQVLPDPDASEMAALKEFMRTGSGTANGDMAELNSSTSVEVVSSNVELRGEGVDNGFLGHGTGRAQPRARATEMIPVFALVQPTPPDGDLTDEELVNLPPQPLIPVVSGQSMRQCDACFLQGTCPKFEAGAACAFEIPVEIKTTDQLTGVLQAMLEMQVQRVAFSRLAEELAGGYPDPTVSAELDRFMGMVAKAQEVLDNRDTLDITIKAKAGGGVLSSIFGSHVGEAAMALPRGGLDERDTDELLGILDAEEVQ